MYRLIFSLVGWSLVSLYMAFFTYIMSQPGMHMPLHVILASWATCAGSFGYTGTRAVRLWDTTWAG